MTRILVLGASGLLGNNIFKYFVSLDRYDVFGTIRSNSCLQFFREDLYRQFLINPDILEIKVIDRLLKEVKPDIVINCIGITNKLNNLTNSDRMNYLTLNSMLPHQLYKICSTYAVRLVHFSTDCVFSGIKGLYSEKDLADSNDFYGRSKYLGEIYEEGSITLRKSIIGQELNSKKGLLNWFLNQKLSVNGYANAIFSGLPVNELAYIIDQYIIPNANLSGLYHLSSLPISKYDLLKLIATVYLKKIDIIKDESIIIDRSLDCSLFAAQTGYEPRPWSDMIKSMHRFNQDI